jgi:hypothetical protein
MTKVTKSTERVNYPECEKWAAVQPQVRAIQAFTEWLEIEKHYELARRGEEGQLTTIRDRVEDLLYQHFEIDPRKLDDERRAMLDRHVKLTERA